MTSELLRADHVRQILQLYREAESLTPGPDRNMHLVAGLERLVGGALAAQSVDEDFGPSRRGRIREYVKTQVSPGMNRLFASMIRHGLTTHPALRALMQRFGGRAALTVRRRDLLGTGPGTTIPSSRSTTGRAGWTTPCSPRVRSDRGGSAG
jgi:hypothetical protein